MRVFRFIALLLILPLAPVQAHPIPGYFIVHYNRVGQDYAGWGLHVWGDGVEPTRSVTWQTPLQTDGRDSFGIFWRVPVSSTMSTFSFIIHKGDEKNTPQDMHAQ
ncbi:MAG: hypothetical protein HKM06_00185, partial [Spirochaetales bacterium]|nr:hypothetical protein [Spirochaetales bacterium]